jgi:hypothetical protein
MAKYRRAWIWVLVNVVALPLVSWVVLIVVSGVVAGVTYSGAELRLSLQFLPLVIIAGAICGLILGLIQGWALRSYGIGVSTWTTATTIGMALDFAVVYGVWFLRAFSGTFAEGAFWILAVVHGCSLAAAQWLALRRSCQPPMSSAWIWLAGISWSIVTPFLLALQVGPASTNEPQFEGLAALAVPILFLAPLLLSLPYIVVTTYLLERQSVRQHVAGSAA